MPEPAAGAIVLGIEASNPSGGGPSVALVRAGTDRDRPWAGEVLARADVVSGGGGRHADELMPTIERVFASVSGLGSGVAGRGLVSRVAVSAGPGGFTGLRVACVTGQMLSLSLGASAVRVPTASAVVAQLLSTGQASSGEPVAVVLASKGARAHVSVVRAEGGALRSGATLAEAHADAAGFASLLLAHGVGLVSGDRFMPASFVDAASSAGTRTVAPVYDACVVAALGGWMSSVEPGALVPIYAREPEAVRLWRAR